MLVAVIDDMLIDLVHDGERIVFDAEFGNKLQLVIGEDLTGRVRRVADQNGLCALLERILQHICIEVELWRHQRHEDRLAVSHNGLRAVIFEIWGEHDDLIAGICQGKDRVDHGLGRADGYDHICIRVKRAAHEAAGLARQRLPEVRRAHRDGVLVRAQCADLGQTVGERLGRIKVGEALRQIDRAAGKTHARHAANHGVGK